MFIYDIISYLENKFPLSSQAGFDNCGVQVGDVDQPLKGILISLDCTEDVLDEAIELGSNLIIAHHPLIFKGIKSITGKNYVERILMKAIANHITIYGLHTNLDHHFSGVNAKIAEKIGVVNTKILSPSEFSLYKLAVFVPKESKESVLQTMFSYGAGQIGNYAECSFQSEGKGTFLPLEGSNPSKGDKFLRNSENEVKLEVIVSHHKLKRVLNAMIDVHPYEEVAYDVVKLENSNFSEGTGMIGELENPIDEFTFLTHLKSVFKCGSIRYTGLRGKLIHKVAFCGGSGSFLLKDAIRRKADVYITGDFKYHEFFDADNKIVIADIGHYESEQFTSELIYDVLREKFVNFAVHLTKVNTNPINYF
jgi:dinuclear metal center YbgI/SA1388 family protein